MYSAMTRLLGLRAVVPHVSRRGLSSQAPSPSNAMDTVVGLTTFMVFFLGPAGYILASLEGYKRRD